MLKLPADVDLGNSDGGGARKERESGGDCLDSSDAPSLSIQEIQSYKAIQAVITT